MTLRQLIRQYIKEGLEKQLNRKNSMKRHYLNEEYDYDDENAYDYDSEYNDRYGKQDKHVDKDLFDIDDFLKILGKYNRVNNIYGTTDAGYFIKSHFFTIKGMYDFDMDFINTHVKPYPSIMKLFVKEIEKKLSIKIGNIQSFNTAIKTLVEKRENYIYYIIKPLYNTDRTLFNTLFDTYASELYKALKLQKYELDIDKILHEYSEDFIQLYR